MSGTVNGGKNASRTNRRKYGEDFYARIGKEGGRKGRTGGFASTKVGADGLTGPERAIAAGVKGGRRSKRRPRSLGNFDLYYEDVVLRKNKE